MHWPDRCAPHCAYGRSQGHCKPWPVMAMDGAAHLERGVPQAHDLQVQNCEHHTQKAAEGANHHGWPHSRHVVGQLGLHLQEGGTQTLDRAGHQLVAANRGFSQLQHMHCKPAVHHCQAPVHISSARAEQ